MMTQAFYTGLAGLRSTSQAMDVVTDNLSNISTVGYRGYSTEFSSMFQKAINTDAASSSVDSGVGVGSQISGVVMDQSQGVFQLTERANDLAILGDGWFGVEGGGQTMYTRDGSFSFDSERSLVTQDGFYVLGSMGNNIENGVLTESLIETPLGTVGTQEKLQFPTTLTFPGEATTEAVFDGNISFTEDQEIEDAAALADSNLQRVTLGMSTTVINSDGVKNRLRLEFTKVDPQVLPGSQWNVSATTETKDGATIFSTETGVMTFSENGSQISNTLTSIDNEGTTVNINMGTDFNGIISASGPFSSSSASNGTPTGELTGYEINKNGEVLAAFTNGVQSSIGKVAVFHFQNDGGLERVSGSKFSQSYNSGQPIFFQDANGKSILGTDLTTGKLEGSNVRMEAGLTDLIIYQRAYDSSSKLITTADQMLQKALNMGA